MDNEAVEVMTYDEARYLDIGTSESSNIQLMNVGISKMDESSNPTEKSVQYVGDKSKSNKVTGYDNQFSIESDLIKNEKVVEDLYNILYYRKTGADAQRDLILVDLWRPITEKKSTYRARKIKTSVVLTDKTSTPGETITFSGNLKGIGDFVYGEFNTSTKAFSESTDTEEDGE